MVYSSVIRWIRALLPAFLIITGVFVVSVFVWLASLGVPPPLIARLERECARLGVPVKIDKIRLEVLDGFGFVARRISVYDPVVVQGRALQDCSPLAEISKIRLDINWASLIEGNNISLDDLSRVEIKGLFLDIPLNGEEKDFFSVEDFNVEFTFLDSHQIEVNRLNFSLEGVDFSFFGRVQLPSLLKQEQKVSVPHEAVVSPVYSPPTSLDRNFGLTQEIINTLAQVKKISETIDYGDTPPRLKVNFDINMDDLSSILLGIDFDAPEITYSGYSFQEVVLTAHYQASVFAVDKLSFSDKDQGTFSWTGRYTPYNRTVTGVVNSHVLLLPIYNAFFDKEPLPYNLHFPYPLSVFAEVSLSFSPHFELEEYDILGVLNSRNLLLGTEEIQEISTDFSVKKDNIFLDNFVIKLASGSLQARVLKIGEKLQASLNSDVSLDSLQQIAIAIDLEEIFSGLTMEGKPLFHGEIKATLPQDKNINPDMEARVNLEAEALGYKDILVQQGALNAEFSQKNNEETKELSRQLNISLDCDYACYGEDLIDGIAFNLEANTLMDTEGALVDGAISFVMVGDGGKYKEYSAKDFIVSVQLEGAEIIHKIYPQWSKKDDIGNEGQALVKITGEHFVSSLCSLKKFFITGDFSGPLTEKIISPELLSTVNINVEGANYFGNDYKKIALKAQYEDGILDVPHLEIIHSTDKKLEVSGRLENMVLNAKIQSNLLFSTIASWIPEPEVLMHNDRLIIFPEGELTVNTDVRWDFEHPENSKASGFASAKNVTYNDVPLDFAYTKFNYGGSELVLSDAKLVFPYADYWMLEKTQYKPRPKSGTFDAKSLEFDFEKNTLNIVKLKGQAYPEPLLNMFAPSVGTVLKWFRFHEAPSVTANGIVDLINPDLRNMDLKITFATPKGGKVDYDFLNGTLNMDNTSGLIHVLKNKLTLKDLKGNIWQGKFEGRLGAYVALRGGYDGSFVFSDCNLKSVGKAFHSTFDDALAQAYINFTMEGEDMKALKAAGRVELTDGNLLSIPFFGPLSGLFESVFGFIPGFGDLTGSRIKQASCNYNIAQGMLMTPDFEASGGNIKINGVANIDMKDSQLDMNIRVDLKSLLGFLLKPFLIPFGGLFEFHGEGDLMTPKWSLTPFSGAHKNKSNS